MTRYVHDGEALAREVGKDLRGLLDDIVKVVPPEEAERVNADKQQAAVPVEEKSAADATTEKPASQPHTLDDPDDFAWDDDDEEDMVKNTESTLVYDLVRKIPYGKVTTYGSIAKMAGYPRRTCKRLN
ncbi:hypothetical protein MOBT1_001573 [Malassezia obtusa]|uniref:Methylated-DNA-[protein]-cysteine S-methyltransferase DNA binding domain-containing protein n=1 Tax=Malassezia obtusa TaxID=76774 RepID=A0AAF0IWC5_9BASI|nr:hypothetical protein MOBT1_001573 [Malassezia obtusa]